MIIGIFDTAIHLPLPEFVLILIGFLIIGFAAGFLWLNRKGGEEALKLEVKKKIEESDQWRLKYYDLTEANEKALNERNETIKEFEEKEEQQAIEIEELTLLNQQLMLKQKNSAAQQTHLMQEAETLRSQISENERILEDLKKQNQSLLQELENSKKITLDTPDHSIIEALEEELKRADVKMKEIDHKTRQLEQLYSEEKYEPLIAQDKPIIENVSSWGMQKLRQELQRLSNQNRLLESKLDRLSKMEEIYESQQKK
ncbi:MAG: hypothetical protein ACK5BV_02295 [Bacteroidota bacterium]